MSWRDRTINQMGRSKRKISTTDGISLFVTPTRRLQKYISGGIKQIDRLEHAVVESHQTFLYFFEYLYNAACHLYFFFCHVLQHYSCYFKMKNLETLLRAFRWFGHVTNTTRD